MAPIGGKCIMHEERRWFVGIDWASQEHVVSLCDGQGKKMGQRKFAHGGTGLSDMIAWLLKTSGGEPGEVHVAIETPHGPIVEALLKRGFNVYSINPKQLDRFRDRFTVAGAKDDSLDAYVLADSLRTDMPLFRKLGVADPLIVELRERSRIDEELKVERLRLANRVRDQLWRYYPQMLELGDLDEDWMLDLWEAAPTPEKASRASKAAIARLLKKYRIRRFDAAQVLSELRKPALSVAQGTIEAATAHIRVAIERLRLVNRQLGEAGLQLDRLRKKLAEPVAGADGENVPGQRQEHRDVTILDSLPGVGRVVLATMLAESPGCSAAARLSCFAHLVWHRPGDAAKWQELHRYASPRLQPALEKRCLQLGNHRSSARLHQQGQIPGSESPRSRPRPRIAFRRRSVALRRLHHAGKGNSVRPFIRGEERSCVIGAHRAGDELHHLLSWLSDEMIGSSEGRAAGPVKADSRRRG